MLSAVLVYGVAFISLIHELSTAQSTFGKSTDSYRTAPCTLTIEVENETLLNLSSAVSQFHVLRYDAIVCI